MVVKSFRAWITIGMKMLPFKEREEMLGPFQVSKPITSVQSQSIGQSSDITIVCGFSPARILTNVESSE
jgi:hypothetical protein